MTFPYYPLQMYMTGSAIYISGICEYKRVYQGATNCGTREISYSSLALQSWPGLNQEHKTSLVTSILFKVTPILHTKFRQVPMHFLLYLDAWSPLLLLSTHGSRIEGAFRWSIVLHAHDLA